LMGNFMVIETSIFIRLWVFSLYWNPTGSTSNKYGQVYYILYVGDSEMKELINKL
jgi:hypothetical protein